FWGLWNALTDITINGLAGSDTIQILRTRPGIPVTVNGGDGDDHISVGSASGTLDTILGPVSVNGQGGTHRLTVNAAGTGSGHTYGLTATPLTRSGAAPIVYGTLEGLVLNAGAGGNYIYVDSTAAGTPVLLDAGAGFNTLQLSGADNTWNLSGNNSGTVS